MISIICLDRPDLIKRLTDRGNQTSNIAIISVTDPEDQAIINNSDTRLSIIAREGPYEDQELSFWDAFRIFKFIHSLPEKNITELWVQSQSGGFIAGGIARYAYFALPKEIVDTKYYFTHNVHVSPSAHIVYQMFLADTVGKTVLENEDTVQLLKRIFDSEKISDSEKRYVSEIFTKLKPTDDKLYF